MDHSEALASNATERYLLGEMCESERYDFEAHYFTCESCAEDVRTAAAMARGIKAVGAEDASAKPRASLARPDRAMDGWMAWLRPAAWVPAAAALVLAILAGYQAFILIPALRRTAATRAVTPIVLLAAARGDEPVVVVDRDAAMAVFAMDVNTSEPGSPLNYTLASADGSARISGAAQTPPPGAQLLLLAPTAELRRPGAWTLTLRTPQGAEVGRYPFLVQFK